MIRTRTNIELHGLCSNYEAILDNLSNGIVIYDVKGNRPHYVFKYINRAVEEIEDINAEELIGKDVIQVFSGIEDMGLLEVFTRVWETGKAEHFPTVLYRDNRISGWRDNYVSKLSANEIMAVYTNEDKIREVELALEESEIFFHSVFDSIQDGITVLDTNMNIIKMNRAMELWYLPQQPYHGTKCYRTFHAFETVCEGCPAQKALLSGETETKMVPRGGPAGTPGWIKLSAFPIVNPEGKTIGVVEHVRNITERKKVEEKLTNSEKKLKDTIEFLPDPTWVIDSTGKVIHWNKAMERLTGIKSEEIVGKGDYEYAIPFYGERRPILIDLVINPDEKWEQKYSYLHKEGGVLANSETYHPSLGESGVYLSATASPLYDSEGQVFGAIETLRDITELKEQSEELEQWNEKLEFRVAEQVAQLEQFAKLEHELKVASDIQKSMLPRSIPNIEGYEIHANLIPAKTVGGDFYEFIPLSENSIAIAIGDVADKGVPAALFMAMVRSFLRAEVRPGVSPKRVLEAVNTHLLGLNDKGVFVTIILGFLDNVKQQFVYSRAGHELPILIDYKGVVQKLDKGKGQALGIFDSVFLDEQTINLSEGSMMLLYTDGISDAINRENKMFGLQGILRTICDMPNQSVSDMGDGLFKEVTKHQGDLPQFDDMAIVAVKSTAG